MAISTSLRNFPASDPADNKAGAGRQFPINLTQLQVVIRFFIVELDGALSKRKRRVKLLERCFHFREQVTHFRVLGMGLGFRLENCSSSFPVAR